MSQLFKKRANSIAKLAIFGGTGLGAMICLTLFGFARSSFWTQVDSRAGFFWLAIMFALALCDYLTRGW